MRTKYVAGISTLAAIVTLGVAVPQFWSTIGWTTPSWHERDINELRQEFVTASEEADEETREFRKEWRCSEWAEDLEDLYADQRAGDDSQRMRDRIEGLRERMDEAGCDRYEDY